jgi:hypothetical protein
MSAINLRENKEPRIFGQHFVSGKFGSSLGQLICFCGDGEIAQAPAIGVHTVDHCEPLHHHSTSIGNLNFMMLLNVNITLESTHEMQGACILPFMSRLVLLRSTGAPQKIHFGAPTQSRLRPTRRVHISHVSLAA